MFNPKFTNKFYFYSLTALSFSIPIHNRLTALIIALIGLFWLIEFNYKEKFNRIKSSKSRKWLLSFSVLYLLFVVGAFYSENVFGYDGGALFNLEKRMSLFVFPLLFSTINIEPISGKLFKQIQKTFILGCILSVFFLVNIAFYRYIQSNDNSEFYYSKLAELHHPSYLALYYTFCIIILLNWLVKPIKRISGRRNSVIILILLFQVMIVLLSSKAGIIGTFIVYGATMVYILLPFNKFKKNRSLIPLSLMVIFIFTLLLNSNSYRRFNSVGKVIENGEEQKTDKIGSTGARIIVWESALEIIKENLVFGVGTGDTKKALLDKYEENNKTIALEKELNAHNEYLQTFMAIGVPGFLVLIFSLLIPAWFAFRKKHLIYLLFLMIIAFHFLVESMLARQAGIVFYAFFNAILFYQMFVNKKVVSS